MVGRTSGPCGSTAQGVIMTKEMRQEMITMLTDVGTLKADVGALKTLTHNIAITVTGHTEAFVRIEQRLTKLDELDGLKKSLEVFTSEIIASRIELRGKQS